MTCLLCRRRDGLPRLLLCGPCLWPVADANRIHGLAMIPVSEDPEMTRATANGGFRADWLDGGEDARDRDHDQRVEVLRAWASFLDRDATALPAGAGPDLELSYWAGGAPSRQLVPALLQWWQGSQSVPPCTPFQASVGATQHAYAGWHQAAPWLWWGGAFWQPDDRFDLVVTVAPDEDGLLPVRVRELYLPMADVDDQPVDEASLDAAVVAAVDAVLDERRVLIRCAAGLNRSGLVVGEVLARLGMPREIIAGHLRRRRRPHVLSNPRFAAWVEHGRDVWQDRPGEDAHE